MIFQNYYYFIKVILEKYSSWQGQIHYVMQYPEPRYFRDKEILEVPKIMCQNLIKFVYLIDFREFFNIKLGPYFC